MTAKVIDGRKIARNLRSNISDEVKAQVETEVKYLGFIQRQLREVERFRKIENIKIPLDLDYSNISGVHCLTNW